MLPVFVTLLTVVIVIVGILLVLIVLMQRPKQEGLGAAFGGGALDASLGPQTTDVLQKGTVWLAVIFFCCAIVLSALKAQQFRAEKASGDILKGLGQEQVEEAPGTTPGISDLPGVEMPAAVGEALDAPEPTRQPGAETTDGDGAEATKLEGTAPAPGEQAPASTPARTEDAANKAPAAASPAASAPAPSESSDSDASPDKPEIEEPAAKPEPEAESGDQPAPQPQQ